MRLNLLYILHSYSACLLPLLADVYYVSCDFELKLSAIFF